MGFSMFKAMRGMIRRLGFVGGLVLALVFAMPAFEAHACAEELSPPSAEASATLPVDGGLACLDCGPACANGCCHAPHAGNAAPTDGVLRTTQRYSVPRAWSHVSGGPLDRPAGPDRPPSH